MLHRNLMVIALALLLGACGFQLRGSGTQTFALTEIDLQARDAFGETARQLEDLLTSSGVRVHAGAPYQLVLLDEQQSQRTVSFTSAARSAEYELSTSLAYQIRTQQLPLLENRLEAQKIYAVDQNNLVGSEQERVQLTQEMRRDLVQQLARRLQALTPDQLDRLRRDAEAKAEAQAPAADNDSPLSPPTP
ncbi:LPS assembly lipoprotein LptE [Pseudomonas sp.]|uniref:LPS-assembly lipoprotein LptE n=1 Tax=Pseudomonas sp. TaxID=306 RepID=UPI0019F12908|nr:LPS assembly lipoprotein LptE [Pseudomonas sp.]MBF0675348.1 hypothetical protein [Pseudomonas sp.]